MTHKETFRQEMIEALLRELVGPDLPPHDTILKEGDSYVEVLQESPTQRYSAGVLFPQSQIMNEVDNTNSDDIDEDIINQNISEISVDDQVEEIDRDGNISDQITDAYDETIRMANEFFPSAMGITFLTIYPVDGLLIKVKASVYESQQSTDSQNRLREWHRKVLDIQPVNWKFSTTCKQEMKEFELAENLRLRTIYNKREDGSFLVTITILNIKISSSSKPPSGSECFFQVGFEVQDPQKKFLFKEYKTFHRRQKDDLSDLDALENSTLELLYRKRKAYAVGHGCSANWGDESNSHTNLIETDVIPQFKVPPIEPRVQGKDELNMYFLSGADGEVHPNHIPMLLYNLTSDYEQWINDRVLDISKLPEDLQTTAKANIKSCRECLTRIRDGIQLLENDERMLKAFMLANMAILMQQYHSRRERRKIGNIWEEFPKSYKPNNINSGRWRTFQICFILMNLSTLAPKKDGTERHERDLVDLIWFPTGGGKTEAYLGLAACDIFYRRLTNPNNAGCTVLMRYTLRLLTSQQFQRASSMICACELLRRKNPKKLGEIPISIGLWVGESLTPTKRHNALSTLNDLASKRNQANNPFQLLKCPWCGTALDDQDNLGYVAHGRPKSVIFVCPEKRCAFSERSTKMPITVIDEDIYDCPPTLLIGTVDKFAMLAWRQSASSIFGLDSDNDYDPPDLIIQDELHLISGPLGSVVGLYECAIDFLCSWKGRKPKIVSSTATIRQAWHQCKSLYDRQTFLYPPQGLDISDSYFAQENHESPGRIYVGVFASAAPSFVTAMVRTLSSLFQSCKTIPLPTGIPDDTRDPYWTVLQYFNSMRELGHAATLVEADIPEYMWAIASRSHLPKDKCRSLGPPVEMTSRRTADEIPNILERLLVRYPRISEDKQRPLDTLLATNMISVGVDVDRLGLMVVVGQPKTTSEYIQASSRVGRSKDTPGLVVTMYNPGKPRDRSHYEYFRAYHSAFYKFVEPTSVTPFSIPALERALHAVFVILTRHFARVDTPSAFNPNDQTVLSFVEYLKNRCRSVDNEHISALEQKIKRVLKDWTDILPSEWGRFGPPPSGRPLMYPAGSEPLKEWDDSPWPTPSSMRNVDVECEAKVVATYDTDES